MLSTANKTETSNGGALNMLSKKSAHWNFAKQAAELRLQGNKALIKKYIKLWPELQKWANGLPN
jgi:hypothetical protein